MVLWIQASVSGQPSLERLHDVDNLGLHASRQEQRQAGKGWLSGDDAPRGSRDGPERTSRSLKQPMSLHSLGISMGLNPEETIMNYRNSGAGSMVAAHTPERGQAGDIWKNALPTSSLGFRLREDAPSLLAPDLRRAEFHPLHLAPARQFLDSQTRDASALAFLDTLAVGKARAFEEDRRREQLQEPWTEEELDVLWTGVRRHGCDWAAMLADPRLRFHESRCAKDLERRWLQDEVKAKKIFGDTLGQSSSQNAAAGNGTTCLEDSLRRLPDIQVPSRIADSSPTATLLSEALKVCGKNKPEVAVEKFLQEKKMLDRRDSLRWTPKQAHERSPSFNTIKYNTALGLGMAEEDKARLPEIGASGITVDFQKLPDLSQLRPVSGGVNPMTTLQGLKSSEAHYVGDSAVNSSLMFPLGGNLDALNLDVRQQAYFDKVDMKSMKMPEMPILEQSQRLQSHLRAPATILDGAQRSLDGQGLQFSPGSMLGLGSSRVLEGRSAVSLPQFGVPGGVDHRKVSSKAGDGGVADKKKLSRHFPSGKGHHLSRDPAVAKGTSSLPHWLKDAFKASEPPPLRPSLAPTIAAVAQAVASLHSGSKSLLPPPALPLPPLKAPAVPGRKKKRQAVPRKQLSAADTGGGVSTLEAQYAQLISGIPQFHQPVSEVPGAHHSLSALNISRTFPTDLAFFRSNGGNVKSFPSLPFSPSAPAGQIAMSGDLSLTPPLPAVDCNSLHLSSLNQSSAVSTISDLLKRRNLVDLDPSTIPGRNFSQSRPCLNLDSSVDVLSSQLYREQSSADLSLTLQKGRAEFLSRQAVADQQLGISELEQRQGTREFLSQEPVKRRIRSESSGLEPGRPEQVKQVEILPPWLRSAAGPAGQVAATTSRDSDVKVRNPVPPQAEVIVLGNSDDSSSETQSDPGIRGKSVNKQEAFTEVSSDETISDN